MNNQCWFPLGLTGLIFQSKGLSSLLQHHSSKASILQRSDFLMVQLSHPYMTTGKIIALKVMSLLLTSPSSVHVCMCSKLLQLYLTLCDTMDHSLPGSSVHGILHAKILEWVLLQGIFLTQGSNLCLFHLLWCLASSLTLAPPGKPRTYDQVLQMTFSFTLFSKNFTALERELCTLSSQVCGQDLGKGNRCFTINCSSLSGGSWFKVRLSVLSTGI